MALRLGKMISTKLPDVEVEYTRTTDVFLPLYQRVGIANKKKADLFISIHCNYISNARTKGTETFVMGLHRAAENLTVAQRENEVILMENDYESNYEGYDPTLQWDTSYFLPFRMPIWKKFGPCRQDRKQFCQ